MDFAGNQPKLKRGGSALGVGELRSSSRHVIELLASLRDQGKREEGFDHKGRRKGVVEGVLTAKEGAGRKL